MQSSYLLARRTLLLHEDGVRSALVGSLTQDFHPITVAGQRWICTILPPPDQFYWSSRQSVKPIQNKNWAMKIAPLRSASYLVVPRDYWICICSTDLRGASN